MPLEPLSTIGDTHWFIHDRFGMFIHWGLYALPARGEWVKSQERMRDEDYQKFFEHFDPDLFDPTEWVRVARQAGMKYFVFTAKHHDGFCLWDTQQTDYKVTRTPFGKDVLRLVVDAFRAEGLRVGFYYSLIDWHHPDFTLDVFHPLRDHLEAEKLNAVRDMRRYAAYVRAQVRELLTGYGPVDILWMDYSYPKNSYKGFPGKGHLDWESDELYRLIRELAPRIILNNRMDLQDVPPDIYSPEQDQPTGWLHVNGQPVVWETCHTFTGSWGYHRERAAWAKPEQLIQFLIDRVAFGGNLLLNVGPTARGALAPNTLDALRVYADWLRLHARSIYGCTQSDFTPPPGVRFTQSQDGGRLYVYVYDWPSRLSYALKLPGLAGKVAYAQLLNDASEIPFMDASLASSRKEKEPQPGTLLLTLPKTRPEVSVPVVELFLQP